MCLYHQPVLIQKHNVSSIAVSSSYVVTVVKAQAVHTCRSQAIQWVGSYTKSGPSFVNLEHVRYALAD